MSSFSRWGDTLECCKDEMGKGFNLKRGVGTGALNLVEFCYCYTMFGCYQDSVKDKHLAGNLYRFVFIILA